MKTITTRKDAIIIPYLNSDVKSQFGVVRPALFNTEIITPTVTEDALRVGYSQHGDLRVVFYTERDGLRDYFASMADEDTAAE